MILLRVAVMKRPAQSMDLNIIKMSEWLLKRGHGRESNEKAVFWKRIQAKIIT